MNVRKAPEPTAAAKAGAIAGSKILSVDGVAYEAARLKLTIQRAKTSKDPISLVLQNGERVFTVRIDYHGGLRYPHLERIPNQPALLDDILAARKN